jgi:hypothetical protein
MDLGSNRRSLAVHPAERRDSAASAVFSTLAAMGFPENLIPQAMSIALSRNPDRIPHIDLIVEVLLNMTTPATTARQRLPPSVRTASASHFLVTSRSLETSVHSRLHPAAAAGGSVRSASQAESAAAPAIPVPDSTSGQVEVISGTLWKQRHIFGFGIQAAEQVEVSLEQNRSSI